jgi:hypothetical protein
LISFRFVVRWRGNAALKMSGKIRRVMSSLTKLAINSNEQDFNLKRSASQFDKKNLQVNPRRGLAPKFWDRCYDFKDIFAKKIGKNIGVFD